MCFIEKITFVYKNLFKNKLTEVLFSGIILLEDKRKDFATE